MQPSNISYAYGKCFLTIEDKCYEVIPGEGYDKREGFFMDEETSMDEYAGTLKVRVEPLTAEEIAAVRAEVDDYNSAPWELKLSQKEDGYVEGDVVTRYYTWVDRSDKYPSVGYQYQEKAEIKPQPTKNLETELSLALSEKIDMSALSDKVWAEWMAKFADTHLKEISRSELEETLTSWDDD